VAEGSARGRAPWPRVPVVGGEEDADGAPDENAHLESFFHSLKSELTHGRSFTSVTELRQAPRRYGQFYNYTRLHSSLGYQSPVDDGRAAA